MSIVYHQSTGLLELRSGLRRLATLGVGYAGAPSGINNPEMEHVKNVGPLPKGSYYLREHRHPRFASPAFELVPTVETARRHRDYGRSGFWIHGDNARGNRSASTGCIVLPLAVRQSVRTQVGRGHTILTVVA